MNSCLREYNRCPSKFREGEHQPLALRSSPRWSRLPQTSGNPLHLLCPSMTSISCSLPSSLIPHWHICGALGARLLPAVIGEAWHKQNAAGLDLRWKCKSDLRRCTSGSSHRICFLYFFTPPPQTLMNVIRTGWAVNIYINCGFFLSYRSHFISVQTYI